MRSDFVKVKLSEHGEKYAGKGGYVTVIHGRHEFHFKTGETQEVTRAFEWEKVLKTELVDGEPLFELVVEEQNDPQPAA